MNRPNTPNKLTITAIDKKTKEPKSPELKYVAQVNPTGYNLALGLDIKKDNQPTSIQAIIRYNKVLPGNLSLQFLFDSTGSLGVETLNERGVKPEIDHFLKVVYEIGEKTPEPNTVLIQWGDLVYPCHLQSVNLEYTHFDLNGYPCRAKASCSFVASDDDKAKKPNLETGSTTQTVEVKDSDTLEQLLANKKAVTTAMIAVAAANKLRSLRGPLGIPTARKLIIPDDLL